MDIAVPPDLIIKIKDGEKIAFSALWQHSGISLGNITGTVIPTVIGDLEVAPKGLDKKKNGGTGYQGRIETM